GFVGEQLEVLYDNDYECKVVCDSVGATYHRPLMPDTHPMFIGTIGSEITKIFPKS
ncbi:ferrochelatase, partial [Staphylococcus pseudintermedius]|uniref:ferrochelatase n=1 Tax=Staphylococcus pseudintermedius TaxID=283734 RepID=UPI0010DF328D